MVLLRKKTPQPGEFWEIDGDRCVQVIRSVTFKFMEVINPVGRLELIDKKDFKWQKIGGNEHESKRKSRRAVNR